MDPRLLDYYNQELQHIREGAAEFAREFPKIASRLALETTNAQGECVDPYVERLLEGFAFLTARIQIKIDAEHARFTQALLEMVYPGYLAPVPSAIIARITPDHGEPGLAEGFRLPRGSVLSTRLEPGQRTPCQFRTAHDVILWPLQIKEAKYFGHVPDLPPGVLNDLNNTVRGCLRLRLAVSAGLSTSQLTLDRLVLHLCGDEVIAHKLHEQLFANCLGVLVTAGSGHNQFSRLLDTGAVQAVGYEDDEAMLPASPRGFAGYRLLKEYSVMPSRFLFAAVQGLLPCLGRCPGNEFELLFLFGKADNVLERSVDVANFALFCVPAVNLFAKRADRIHLGKLDHEHHVVPDRARPMDYEIFQVTGVTGYGESGVDEGQVFEPLYALHDLSTHQGQGYYALRRTPRVLSENQRQRGPRTGYVGTEVFLSLVDPTSAPYSTRIAQLAVETLCTNRDLPLTLAFTGKDDFSLEVAAPIERISCIKGPSRPAAPVTEGEIPWRLISHLSLNYLSATDSNPQEGAAALREILFLYGLDSRSPVRKQIEGVHSVATRRSFRRMPVAGPIAFGRGVEVALTLDERAFDGTGILLLAGVLERLFARHASMNSFSETVLHSVTRGEIKRWPPRLGQRSIL